MMDEAVPQFSSIQEECTYWKNSAMQYKQGMETAREELDEFQLSSRELEAELEAQLEHCEQKLKEERIRANKLLMENEVLKERLEVLHLETNQRETELEEELSHIKTLDQGLQKYIRQLEQSNDDLERSKRATLVSLEDFEGRLNTAIERNAFLESELDEKESLKEMVQRLKDEARDMRQELMIQGRSSDSPEPDNDKVAIEQKMDSNKLTAEIQTQTAQSPGLKSPPNSVTSTPSVPLTPSTRISALNIVGDLLRRVGALESKLASCRNFVKDNPKSSFSNKESRTKRIPRGQSTPNVQSLIHT